MIAVKIFIVAFLLCRVIVTDVREGKIENRIILMGYVLAFALAYIKEGIPGILVSTKAAGFMILSLFFLFLLKGLGAGDIKLLSVIAAFFPKNGFHIAVLAFFAGALFAVIRMVYRGIRKEPVYIKKETLHFSIPIAFATGLEIWMYLM